MNTAIIGPIVEEIPGEPLRFLVHSRTAELKQYLVDLEEFDFNGQCGCDNFEYRFQPMLKKGAPASDQLRCWHIRQSRQFFLELTLREKAAEMCR
jgi:hypothetical protein